MEVLFKQIEEAALSELYWVSLLSALSIPDICSSLESEDGEANKKKYIKWVDTWLSSRYIVGEEARITGEVLYFYRCSILHQGTSNHPKMPYERILFIHPQFKGVSAHNAIISNSLSIDILEFVKDLVDVGRKWYQEHKDKQYFKKNFKSFMRLYPQGKKPLFGIPWIG